MTDIGDLWYKSKKWMPFFADFHAIVFCIDISTYDVINEYGHNELQKTLKHFQEICNSRWFYDESFMMIFTHIEQFKEKIVHGANLSTCFPKYDGNYLLFFVSLYMYAQTKNRVLTFFIGLFLFQVVEILIQQ